MDSIRAEVLVTAERLADHLADDDPIVLLDVRWSPTAPDGRSAYRAEHLPGAVYVPLAEELAAPPSPAKGRHPLPELMNLEASARRWGLESGVRVVAYDDAGGVGAARAWWLLRWAGVSEVKILDGGLQAWREAHGPLESGEVVPAVGHIRLVPDGMLVVDADGAAQVAQSGILIDARARRAFAGLLVEAGDERPGHIPGAVNIPTRLNLDDQMRFLQPDRLQERFHARGLGVDLAMQVGVYCGSSVMAAHEIAALASVGYSASLYSGSWSGWASDPTRPVQTGGPEDVPPQEYLRPDEAW